MTSVWNRDILEGHCLEQSGWWAELPGYRKPLWGGGEGLWRKRQESFPGDKPLLWGARHMPASPYVLLHFLWPLPSLLSRLITFPVGQDSLPWFSKSVPRLLGGAQWKPAETSCLLAEDRAEQGWRTEKQQKRPRCKMTLWGFYWFFWGEGWYFWPHCVGCGILVPEPGIEPVPPTVKMWIVDHWATRQVPWLLVKSARASPVACLWNASETMGLPGTAWSHHSTFLNACCHSHLFSLTLSHPCCLSLTFRPCFLPCHGAGFLTSLEFSIPLDEWAARGNSASLSSELLVLGWEWLELEAQPPCPFPGARASLNLQGALQLILGWKCSFWSGP